MSGDELALRLQGRDQRFGHADPEYGPKPQILAGMLVCQLLVYTSTPLVDRVGAYGKTCVVEHALDAQHFEPLVGVGVGEKGISH